MLCLFQHRVSHLFFCPSKNSHLFVITKRTLHQIQRRFEIFWWKSVMNAATNGFSSLSLLPFFLVEFEFLFQLFFRSSSSFLFIYLFIHLWRLEPNKKNVNEIKSARCLVFFIIFVCCWMNFCCSPISSTVTSELFGEKRNRNRNAVMWPLFAGLAECVLYVNDAHTKFDSAVCAEEGKEYMVYATEKISERRWLRSEEEQNKKKYTKINNNNSANYVCILEWKRPRWQNTE